MRMTTVWTPVGETYPTEFLSNGIFSAHPAFTPYAGSDMDPWKRKFRSVRTHHFVAGFYPRKLTHSPNSRKNPRNEKEHTSGEATAWA